MRVLEADRTSIGHPAGIAFSARANAFYALPGDVDPTAVVTKLTPFGAAAGSVRLPAAVADPANVAYDAREGRLLLLAGPSTLLAVPEVGASLDVASVVRMDVRSLGVTQPRGLAVDARTGRLSILDAVGPRIVSVDPSPDGGYAGGQPSTHDLRIGDAADVRGLALDPATGDFQTLSQSRGALFEVTRTGELVATRDLTPFHLRRPTGLVVAPSGDTTDDPSQVSVYVADQGAAGGATTPGGIVELSLVEPLAAASVSFRSSLVRTTNTANWSPPSPDPSGLAYLPQSRTLQMVDGEVEETVGGITHFAGANAWEMTLAGSVVRTANISKIAPTVVPMTNEPTGVAWNPTNGHYYVSDDSALRVYDDNPRGDGIFGTADDTWTSFDTTTGGSGDSEGVAYDSFHDRIFVADGVNAEIYEFTTSGSPVRHFDVQQYGVVDPESVEFNPDSGTLFVLSNHANPIIVETTTSGTLLQTIDFSAAPQVAPAGLAYAPASDGSPAKRFYVVDRGIDNDSDPRIVDGKMFELTAPTASTPGNLPPTVNAGPDQAVELPNQAILDGTVTDDGIPNPPGAVTTTWTQEGGPGTVTFQNAAAVDTTASFSSIGTYVLRLTATDGEASSADELTVTVTGAGGTSAIDVRVAAGSDDAEESGSGTVSLTSTDLELVFDGSNQVVGMRFNGVTIPRSTPIVNAYIQFAVDEVSTGAAALTVAGFAADNVTTFTTASRDVSNRPRTAASVAWSPPDWPTIGETGAAQRTPNLAPIIQQVVDRAGWSSGNSLGLVITGTGHRTAEAFEGSPGTAPLLHIEYGGSPPPPTNTAPSVTIDPVAPVTLPAGTSLTGHVTDDGLPNPPGATTLSWTKQSGPGTVTFGSPTAATTTVSFSAAGSYVLRLTANDSALNGFADVTVTVNPAPPTNTAPTVSIDPVPAVTLPAGATLTGHVTDDGLPNPPGATTLAWTKQSGPPGSQVTFADASAASTTASFSDAGSYVLRLTASDSALSSFADVTVTVNPPATNTAPTVSIDPVAPVTLPAGTSLTGHVTDDGLPNPPGATTLSWTEQSGPGTVTFGSPTAATTTASFDTAGSYVLRLTANDSVLSGFAEVTVNVNPAPTNTAPSVSIDPVAPVTLPAGTSVTGHVSDDGLPNPPGATTLSWTKQSGPGTVTFGSPAAATTTVSFGAAGSYVLRLTADDSALSGFAEVTVTVNPAPPTNTAPSVSIDPVAPVTPPASASLTGHVSDDGLPNPPGATTLSWTKQSGPGTVTFGSPTAASTTASFSAAGTYVLRLTANDSALSGFAEVTVTVNPEPPMFADGFESGDLSAWSSSTIGNGDLSVTAAAALVGARGLQAVINDNQPIYVTDDTPQAETRYHARFSFDLNSITMAKNDTHTVFAAADASGATVAQVELRFVGGKYQLRPALLTDGGTSTMGASARITDAPHVVELSWQAATAAGANNGGSTLWIDGVQVVSLAGVDNDTRRIERASLGAVAGIDTGTRGTEYFDAFEARRIT